MTIRRRTRAGHRIFRDFEHSIAASDSLINCYKEIRVSRGLGQRGQLGQRNEDLLWLPRSAVVTALSALDAYVHEVVYDKLPSSLSRDDIPDPLADQISKLISIKNAQDFKDAFKIFSSGDINQSVCSVLVEKVIKYQSYQSPDKIIQAYKLIGFPNIFRDVSAYWSGPSSNDEYIRRKLSGYNNRRNQIAHDGDRSEGSVQHMTPIYAKGCRDYVQNLTVRMHRVVYGYQP